MKKIHIMIMIGSVICIILLGLILNKVDKNESYSDDPPRSCGLPKYTHPYGLYSMPYSCDVSYPGDGNEYGWCINQDKGLTCQAYQAQDPTKFASICTSNVPCVSDDDCSASKVYNKCAQSGPLKGTCQALDEKGNFMCGDKPGYCTAYDGSSGNCVNGGCQPRISCKTPDGKTGELNCGKCQSYPSSSSIPARNKLNSSDGPCSPCTKLPIPCCEDGANPKLCQIATLANKYAFDLSSSDIFLDLVMKDPDTALKLLQTNPDPLIFPGSPGVPLGCGDLSFFGCETYVQAYASQSDSPPPCLDSGEVHTTVW